MSLAPEAQQHVFERRRELFDARGMKLVCAFCGEEMVLEASAVLFEFEPVDTGPVCDRCRAAEASQQTTDQTRSGATSEQEKSSLSV